MRCVNSLVVILLFALLPLGCVVVDGPAAPSDEMLVSGSGSGSGTAADGGSAGEEWAPPPALDVEYYLVPALDAGVGDAGDAGAGDAGAGDSGMDQGDPLVDQRIRDLAGGEAVEVVRDPETDAVLSVTVMPESVLESAMMASATPNPFECVQASVTTCSSTGGRGTNCFPSVDSRWAGSQLGGCGTWATMMCNRVLRRTSGTPTMSEWNQVASGIRQNATGGSSAADVDRYYRDQGYCVGSRTFRGSAGDYRFAEDLVRRGCDVKLRYYKRRLFGVTNGHVETVTAASGSSMTMTTNSAGYGATISGGTNGNFSHSNQGRGFPSNTWPANRTTVMLDWVCPCGTFGRLNSAL